MKLPGLKLSKDEVSQEFDLKEILGIDVTKDEGLQEAIAQAIIDKIVERTESGRGSSGKKLAKYSSSYKDSLEFKAFGKDNNVNMTLSGEMLGMITVTSQKGGRIKIGWDDAENNAKAFGHMSGMEGHPHLEGLAPVRDFFGLTKAEIKELRDEFRPDSSEESDQTDRKIMDRLNKLGGDNNGA